MKDLLKNIDGSMTQINNICMEQKPGLPIFNKTDKEVIAKYIEIMTPIAVRMDMLQDEKNGCVGVLLTSSSSRTISWKCNERCKNLTMPKNLVNYLLKQPKPNKGKEKDFELRFSSIFNDFDFLMATGQHLHFKLEVV